MKYSSSTSLSLLILSTLLVSCSGTKLTTHVEDIDQSQFDTIVFLGQHVTDDGSTSSEMYSAIRENKGLIAKVFSDSLTQEGIEMTLDENNYFSNIEAVKEILRIDEEFGKKGFDAANFQNEIVFTNENKNNAKYGVFFIFKTKSAPFKYDRVVGYSDLTYVQSAHKNLSLRIYLFDLNSKEIVGYSKYSDQGLLDGKHFKDIFFSFVSTFKYNYPLEPSTIDYLRNQHQIVTLTKTDGSVLIGKIEITQHYNVSINTEGEPLEIEIRDIDSLVDSETGVQLYPKS